MKVMMLIGGLQTRISRKDCHSLMCNPGIHGPKPFGPGPSGSVLVLGSLVDPWCNPIYRVGDLGYFKSTYSKRGCQERCRKTKECNAFAYDGKWFRSNSFWPIYSRTRTRLVRQVPKIHIHWSQWILLWGILIRYHCFTKHINISMELRTHLCIIGKSIIAWWA